MGEMILFFASVGLLLLAAFLYISRENDHYGSLIERVDFLEKEIASVKKINKSDENQVILNMTEDIEKLRSKIEEVEKKPQNLNLTFPRPVPVNLVYKKSEGKKTPLLDRAGIKK